MLDYTLEQLGVPLEGHTMEPAVSVGDTPADENTRDHNRVPVLSVAKERRVSKRPPVAIIRGDGGYDSHEVFPQKAGVSEPPCV